MFKEQLERISIYRQIILALLDTFFYKVKKHKGWNPFFDGFILNKFDEAINGAPAAVEPTRIREAL